MNTLQKSELEKPARGSFKGSVLASGAAETQPIVTAGADGPQLSGGPSDFHLLVEHRPSELVLNTTTLSSQLNQSQAAPQPEVTPHNILTIYGCPPC